MRLALFGVVTMLVITSVCSSAPVRWEIANGGNGHLYEAILAPPSITWTEANTAAQARGAGWRLATITSAAENAFVFDLIKDDPRYWHCCSSGNSTGPWLGGFKSGPGPGDFSWVTAEPFVYTNWGPTAPNNDGDRIAFFGYQTLIGSGWNDMPDDFGIFVSVPAYVVENSGGEPIPEPSTVLLSIIGILTIAILRKKERLRC